VGPLSLVKNASSSDMDKKMEEVVGDEKDGKEVSMEKGLLSHCQVSA